VILEVPQAGAPPLRVVLEIDSATTATRSRREVSPAGPVERLVTQAPTISAVSRNFTGRFLPNQPVYYLYGDSDQAAKFQFSFDNRSATFEAGKSEPATSVRSLQLGCTQRSLWDLQPLLRHELHAGDSHLQRPANAGTGFQPVHVGLLVDLQRRKFRRGA
jgi:hypothetical protein